MSSEKKPGWVILYRGLYILLPSPNSRDSNKPLDVGSTPPTQDPIVANKGLGWDFQTCNPGVSTYYYLVGRYKL